MSMHAKKHRHPGLLLILGLCGLLVSIGFLSSSFWLKTVTYTVKDSRISEPFRIVFLADLHNQSFGRENERLIRTIAAQKPDVIALVGDILEAEDPSSMTDLTPLITALGRIAPVYFALGNDESTFLRKDNEAFHNWIDSTGAIFLEEAYGDITIRSTAIRLGGFYGFAFRNDQSDAEWMNSARYSFLSDFQDTDRLKVLLSHKPDSFVFHEAYRNWAIDLALCGHTHGGLMRLPLLGGLFAPDQGWFPKFVYGRYELDGMTMLITSGLSGYKWIPRFGNRPEIAVVNFEN